MGIVAVPWVCIGAAVDTEQGMYELREKKKQRTPPQRPRDAFLENHCEARSGDENERAMMRNPEAESSTWGESGETGMRVMIHSHSLPHV